MCPTCRLKMSVANRHWDHDVNHVCGEYRKRNNTDEPTVLYPHCPYFARKFAKHSSSEVATLLEQLKIAA